MLLIALCIVGWLYKKEKEATTEAVKARVDAVEAHSIETSKLKTLFSEKVEQLLRERIESESEMQKALIENKEIMQTVVMTVNNCNTALANLLED